jgi:hypothetical protein
MTIEARAQSLNNPIDITDDDIFLPKVRKLRPDGASLSAVYKSKKEDIWGKILQQQLREEVGV